MTNVNLKMLKDTDGNAFVPFSTTDAVFKDGTNQTVSDLLDGKQATLVSGTNIKTINNESLLGAGNITVSAEDEIAISTTEPTGDEVLWINPNEVMSGFDLNKIYPVGSIYINTTGTNPSTFLGGTWTSFGAGRVLVGQDTNDTDFDTLGVTGGSKYLQRHYHESIILSGTPIVAWNSQGGSTENYAIESTYKTTGTANQNYFKTSEAGTGNSGNLQPYIVVSMWVRTA